MKTSWLVQRLCAPLVAPTGLLGPDNPFAFGGGLKNGGLSGEAMEMLRPLFRFDYMGSAEFEFGAVPEALAQLAAAAAAPGEGLVAGKFTVEMVNVGAHWTDKRKPRTVESEPARTIFFLCRTEDQAEVESRIRAWAAERWNQNLKEDTRLACVLRPWSDYEKEDALGGHGVQGWLELDNGFFFSVSETMFAGMCHLFGVGVDADGA